jgi:hypothetical protein
MSLEQHVFLHGSKVPSRDAWQHAIERLGFPTTLDPELNVQEDSGFSPAIYNGVATGFEFYLGPAAEILSNYAHIAEQVGSRDMCATFCIGADLVAFAAASSSAAALTQLTDGVFVCDDTIYTAEDVVEATRRELSSIDSSSDTALAQATRPSPPTLRLARRETTDHTEPAGLPVPFSPDELALMRAEYQSIKTRRVIWSVLSLLFGGTGVLLILLVDPKKAPVSLTISALVMFGLGLMFSGKFKGRGLWWGFTALGRISLIRRATEPDLLKKRLEELKRTLEAHGEKG